jgi:adenine-specific DNA-methyltransferase
MTGSTPHLKLRTLPDGGLQVEFRGLDVYDSTTGEIRSNTTAEVAGWFIDTDYDDESFFVRNAYFTGADQPHQKLQRVLKAEIDEAAWSTLHSTVRRPSAPPSTGKIAVKVINRYGDEVPTVYNTTVSLVLDRDVNTVGWGSCRADRSD